MGQHWGSSRWTARPAQRRSLPGRGGGVDGVGSSNSDEGTHWVGFSELAGLCLLGLRCHSFSKGVTPGA